MKNKINFYIFKVICIILYMNSNKFKECLNINSISIKGYWDWTFS